MLLAPRTGQYVHVAITLCIFCVRFGAHPSCSMEPTRSAVFSLDGMNL